MYKDCSYCKKAGQPTPLAGLLGGEMLSVNEQAADYVIGHMSDHLIS